jgi:hypothetical protein
MAKTISGMKWGKTIQKNHKEELAEGNVIAICIVN